MSTFNIKLLVSRIVTTNNTLVRKGALLVPETTTKETMTKVYNNITQATERKTQAKARANRMYNGKIRKLKEEVKMAILALREGLNNPMRELAAASKEVGLRLIGKVTDLAQTILTAEEISVEIVQSLKRRVWSNLYKQGLGA